MKLSPLKDETAVVTFLVPVHYYDSLKTTSLMTFSTTPHRLDIRTFPLNPHFFV
jgi:hypothetical protein